MRISGSFFPPSLLEGQNRLPVSYLLQYCLSGSICPSSPLPRGIRFYISDIFISAIDFPNQTVPQTLSDLSVGRLKIHDKDTGIPCAPYSFHSTQGASVEEILSRCAPHTVSEALGF